MVSHWVGEWVASWVRYLAVPMALAKAAGSVDQLVEPFVASSDALMAECSVCCLADKLE